MNEPSDGPGSRRQSRVSSSTPADPNRIGALGSCDGERLGRGRCITTVSTSRPSTCHAAREGGFLAMRDSRTNRGTRQRARAGYSMGGARTVESTRLLSTNTRELERAVWRRAKRVAREWKLGRDMRALPRRTPPQPFSPSCFLFRPTHLGGSLHHAPVEGLPTRRRCGVRRNALLLRHVLEVVRLQRRRQLLLAVVRRHQHHGVFLHGHAVEERAVLSALQHHAHDLLALVVVSRLVHLLLALVLPLLLPAAAASRRRAGEPSLKLSPHARASRAPPPPNSHQPGRSGLIVGRTFFRLGHPGPPPAGAA